MRAKAVFRPNHLPTRFMRKSSVYYIQMNANSSTLFPEVKNLLYQSRRKLGGVPEPVWTCWQRENSLPPVNNITLLVQSIICHFTDWTITSTDMYDFLYILSETFICIYLFILQRRETLFKWNCVMHHIYYPPDTEICSVRLNTAERQIIFRWSVYYAPRGHFACKPQ
jgi:hypothetical protein